MAVKNAGTFHTAVSQLESRVVQRPHQDATSGKVSCPFEARVMQESGAH